MVDFNTHSCLRNTHYNVHSWSCYLKKAAWASVDLQGLRGGGLVFLELTIIKSEEQRERALVQCFVPILL